MASIGQTTQAPVIQHHVNQGVNLMRPAATALQSGRLVHLNSDGKWAQSTATDTPLGVCMSDVAQDENLTVITFAFAIVRALAGSGGVTRGARVTQTNASGNLGTFIATANGAYVQGIALTGGSADAEISVALLPPFRITNPA